MHDQTAIAEEKKRKRKKEAKTSERESKKGDINCRAQPRHRDYVVFTALFCFLSYWGKEGRKDVERVPAREAIRLVPFLGLGLRETRR